ncbi:MAG: SGNH/GDSL hydrolase family protein [Ktedonobacterales bacterium]
MPGLHMPYLVCATMVCATMVCATMRRRTHRLTLAPMLAFALLGSVLLAGCAGPSAGSQAATPAVASHPAALTYVAIGASDAFGIGTDDPDRQAWPTDLAADLGPTVHLINLGVPGETAALAINNELPIANDTHPAVITVWLAVNDFADDVPLADYRAQLGQLLTGLRQGAPHARIVVGNIPDLTLVPQFWGDDPVVLRAQVRAWNAAIAADCAAANVTLLDLYSGWPELAQHPEYIAGDGFHPSTQGAQRLAQLFAAAIQHAALP